MNTPRPQPVGAQRDAAALAGVGMLPLLLLTLLLLPVAPSVGVSAENEKEKEKGAAATAAAGAADFRREIRPILQEFCFDCHADGASKGHVAFDTFPTDQELLGSHDLWWKALKNLRAGLMPPQKKAQPSAVQRQRIEEWIKTAVFEVNPVDPDPGHVTVRRLNRAEYRNTIRDLMGVEFDTEKEFPPDDSGHGFDNIGDVLTLPPMLLEKYLAAARTIVTKGVPAVSRVPAEQALNGRSFKGGEGSTFVRTNRGPAGGTALILSYYDTASVSNRFKAAVAGRYQLLLDLTANERFVDNQFDYNKCRLILRADGRELLRKEYTREGGKAFHYESDLSWTEGEHTVSVEVEPLTPDQKQVRSLTLRLDTVTLRGPLEEKHWVKPANHTRFYPREVPASEPARRQYAREILGSFVQKAYRRPVDSRTVDRLVSLAEQTSRPRGKTFEAGISQAMVAVLASPRFLFREEGTAEPERTAGARRGPAKGYPAVDEYSLASRLSYFFWSSMPDETLSALAAAGRLRENLTAQTERLLQDKRSEAFTRNFVGQWLQTRDIEGIPIDARQVLAREAAFDPEAERRRARSKELRDREDKLTPAEKKELEEIRATFFGRFNRPVRAELNGDLRRAMRQETEKTFEYVIRQDRPLLELVDSDYTFLNERLARHYGLTNLNLKGEEMRRVTFPPDSPRGGGVITHGSVLVVTSNPTRTSPVKRGLFILDNILGTPPPPPPPDIPPLEDAAKAIKDRPLSLRETLALHREQPLCSSCHNRMDPLGLALENFNAMGMWREQERNQAIDPTGRLLSGEEFQTIRQLKGVLAQRHGSDFYRTLTEKLLTYALGRGLEYYDVATVDHIVQRLEKENGRASVLLSGIVESAAFQKTRRPSPQL